MIRTFADKATKKLFETDEYVSEWNQIKRVAKRKLFQLAIAKSLMELVGSGNRLESLRGERRGQYSIRINDQFRICFIWEKGYAYEVEIEYYIMTVINKKVPHISHPGKILWEEFLQPSRISSEQLAREIGIEPSLIIEEIVNLRR
jgi:proteic killer suppression protein